MLKAAFGLAAAVVLAGSATLAEAQGPERSDDGRGRQRGGPASAQRQQVDRGGERAAPRREVAPPRARAEPPAAQMRERTQERGRRADERRREMPQQRAAEHQRTQEQRAGERPRMLEQRRAAERQRADDRRRAVEQRRATEELEAAQRRQLVDQRRAAEKEKAAERQRVLEQRKAERRPDQSERRAAEQREGPRAAKYEQVRTERAKLAVEQRVRLRKAFRPDRDRLTRVRFTARVGTRIPRSVRLFAVPAAVYAIFPYYRDYRYVVVEDTICIVDPVTYEIIDALDDPGVPDASPQVAELRLTERESAIVLESIPPDHPEAQVRLRLALGAEIPNGVGLYTFAPSVIDQVPKLGEFRFIATRDQVVIVDPRDRDIALVLDR